MLLRQVDRQIGLSKAVASVLEDTRRQASCKHDGLSLLQQRIYGLASGHDCAIRMAYSRSDGRTIHCLVRRYTQ
ncbi:MAG: transposase [Nitrosomonas halophila]|uniref:Transposase DDE domain group 1 n=1 Tax=Nitrosomonas halophila TaxID=44576 RepID=A0A1H3H4A2_9PROT|nr:transposase [Nitrosomonas halophila]SDY10413.1 Transposase DDE domain group 1 [Nitrosomonas halophila]